MNKTLFLLIFSFNIQLLSAQFKITGNVKNETGDNLNNVKVYLDGSLYQTTTNQNGDFILDVPKRNYQLIVTKEFYTNSIIQINGQTKFPLNIILETENINLEETVIQSLTKDERAYFLAQFKQYFLGRELSANQCKILNENDLRFNYDKKDRILKVSARKPLLIKNNYLGFEIEYDLVDFEIDYKTHYVLVLGTSNFKQLKGNNLKKWNKNRKEAYLGSVEHFVKSAYNNKITTEGFDVKRLIRKENPAYLKFKEDLENSLDKRISAKVPPKIISILINQPVPIDSLVTNHQNKKYFNFDGLYSVEYTKAKEDAAYAQKIRGTNLVGNQLSVFSLVQPIQIFDDGNYFQPEDLIVEGYFGYRKIADLLPLDFEINYE